MTLALTSFWPHLRLLIPPGLQPSRFESLAGVSIGPVPSPPNLRRYSWTRGLEICLVMFSEICHISHIPTRSFRYRSNMLDECGQSVNFGTLICMLTQIIILRGRCHTQTVHIWPLQPEAFEISVRAPAQIKTASRDNFAFGNGSQAQSSLAWPWNESYGLVTQLSRYKAPRDLLKRLITNEPVAAALIHVIPCRPPSDLSCNCRDRYRNVTTQYWALLRNVQQS